MGFFSSLGRTLTGGSQSSSGSQAQSGFALLPSELQAAFKNYATDLTDTFAGDTSTMFTPLGQTDYETSALSAISRGLSPTQESLTSDIAMQMNPFNEFVINDINRQAQGDYSILKQAATDAGQFGSNRQMLGANDIEQTRLNTIGKLQQDQYNKALENSLNEMSSLRQGDIANQFTAGEFLRNLDMSTQQAPIASLRTFGELLGALPQSGGSTSSSSSRSESSNKGIGGTIAALASAFSDVRLKENIEKVGVENGYNIYEFNYRNDPLHRFRGVMAQEVLQKDPEAVGVRDGYLTVNYDRIGLKMVEAH